MDLVLGRDLDRYFQQQLTQAIRKQGLALSNQTELYLVQLLRKFALRFQPPEEDLPFALRLHRALNTAELSQRLQLLGQTADDALYLSGLFVEHLQRRGIAPTYITTIGRRAYSVAAELGAQSMLAGWRSKAQVFVELATSFPVIASLLSAVEDVGSLQTPQQIVREYDRWRRSSSEQAAARLRAAGVPLYAKTETLH